MKKNVIIILPGKYEGNIVGVESDWSAASYYFSVCALSKKSEIKIKGLFANSLQGDSVLPEIYKLLGVKSFFSDDWVERWENLYRKNWAKRIKEKGEKELNASFRIVLASFNIEFHTLLFSFFSQLIS